MWKEDLPDGRVRFRDFYTDPLTGKIHKPSVTVARDTSHTRKEAQIKLDDKIRKALAAAQDGHIKHGLRFKELAKRWLADYKLQVRIHSYNNAESRTRRMMRDINPDCLVEKITPNYITNYLMDMLYKEELKNSTVSQLKQTLSLMFKWAVLNNYLKESPMKKVEVKYRSNDGSTRPEQKYLEADELEKVLACQYEWAPVYGRFCEFLYLTGLRYGEAAALTKDDIHGDTASINGTLIKPVGKPAYKQPWTKSASGMRKITLPKKAVKILEDQQQEFPNGRFIFRTKLKDFMPEITLSQQLRKDKKKLGLERKKVDCHIFRHTHVSKLAELGVPLYVIQAHMGHSERIITEKIYLHVTKEAQQQLDSKIDEL